MELRPEFDQFYSGAYRPLVIQLYALTGDRAQAEDVAQEAFVRAWLNWGRISAYEEPHAWIRKVGFRIAVSRWRRARKLARLLVTLAEPQEVPGPGPLSVTLVSALRTLPVPQRRALVLHYMCGLSVAAIAEEEGVREGTVKSRLSRGRAALSKLLNDEPVREMTANKGLT